MRVIILAFALLIFQSQATLAQSALPRGHQLFSLIAQAKANPVLRNQLKAQALKLAVEIHNSGRTEIVLREFLEQAKKNGEKIPVPEGGEEALVTELTRMIDAELSLRGLTPSSSGRSYQDWDTVSEGSFSKISQKPLEEIGRTHWVQGNGVKWLTDGPASFNERKRLIREAKNTIHVLTWAFYDDETGWRTALELSRRAGEGVLVRVVVDGSIAKQANHSETLNFMENNGVLVLRWKHANFPHHGMHRKIMVVDGQAAIIGGMNIGNAYSHLGAQPAGKMGKWRDQDVLLEGPIVNEAEKLFSTIWNEQVHENGLQFFPMEFKPSLIPEKGSASVALVDHSPTRNTEDPIYLSALHLIQNAQRSIDIENAYVILTPAISAALSNAIGRGIKVRILTNSSDSVDEEVVSIPILNSAAVLASAGAEIYLKKGSTLHSKFMIVDGTLSWIGSYNFHPRSLRYEAESVALIRSVSHAKELTEVFKNDIAEATLVKSPHDIAIPQSSISELGMLFFFNQL